MVSLRSELCFYGFLGHTLFTSLLTSPRAFCRMWTHGLSRVPKLKAGTCCQFSVSDTSLWLLEEEEKNRSSPTETAGGGGNFSAGEYNYPNWNMARILELIIPSALAKRAIGTLMTASGQRASYHISNTDIKQIRSVDISDIHVTQAFLDGLWLQPSGSGGN